MLRHGRYGEIMKVIQQDYNYTLNALSQEERRKLSGSTILITGCGGFLGYYFMNFFAQKAGALGIKRLIGLDNFILGKPLWLEALECDPNIEIHMFDIASDDISDIRSAANADYVIHMASIASPTFYRKYPIETLDANIWGLRSLLNFYKEKNIQGLLFYSSSEVYGDPDATHIPTDEMYHGNVSFTGPRACYDESKRFGETMCVLYADKYSMPIGVARPFNNYGPGMKLTDKRVPADFAKAVIENRNIEILSNGTPTRTFCYIADAIAGDIKILLHGKYDCFNIGIESPEISIGDLAKIYACKGAEIFGYTGQVTYASAVDTKYLTDNPQRRCPNIDKARSVLQYNPTIFIEDGVGRFLQFIKENQWGEVK